MGYEIVYCGTCQGQVRGADLEKGPAIRVDGQAYCGKCASAVLKTLPLDQAEALRGRNPPRTPSANRITSARLPALPAPSRPPSGTRKIPLAAPPAPNRTVLYVVAGVAAIAIFAMILMVVSGGSSRDDLERPPQPAPTAAPAPAAAKSTKPAESPEAAKAIADLEQLAASSQDPMEILIKCEEVKAILRGTRHEAPLAKIQARAVEAKKARDLDQSVAMGLEQVRSIRKFDPRFEKRDEVNRLLDRMKEMGGPRQAEVARTIEEYRKESQEAEARARGLAAWYRFLSADRLGRDDSRNENHATSVEGAGLADGGPGLRLQGSGSLAVPVSIRSDFTIAMRLRTRQFAEGTERHWWRGAGLVDAEVPGVVDDFGTSILGSKFAFGVGNPDTSMFSKSDVNDGRWRHVAATRDGRSGEMKVYVDGVLEGTIIGPKGDRTAPQRLVIGNLQTGFGPFVGDLDDVRLYVRVLAAAEVAALAGGK